MHIFSASEQNYKVTQDIYNPKAVMQLFVIKVLRYSDSAVLLYDVLLQKSIPVNSEFV